MCHHEGIGCKRTRCHRTSTIEAKPTKPEKRSTQKCHGEVVGRHGLIPIALFFSHNEGGSQCSDTRADMDDKAPSKIKGAKISDPAAHTPNPVGKRVIDKCCPKNEENKIGLKLKPFSKCAGDQGRSNDSKHHLKNHECLMWDGGCIIGICVETNP